MTDVVNVSSPLTEISLSHGPSPFASPSMSVPPSVPIVEQALESSSSSPNVFDSGRQFSPTRRRHSHQLLPHELSPCPHVSADVTAAADLAMFVEREELYLTSSCYLDGDSVVTPLIREQVAAWTIDVASELCLDDHIAAIALNLMDRFMLARSDLPLKALRTLIATCMILALKVVENDSPWLHTKIAHLSESKLADVILMEKVVLDVLRWRVNVVTAREVYEALWASASPDAEISNPAESGKVNNKDDAAVAAAANSLLVCALLERAPLDARPTALAAAVATLAHSLAYPDRTKEQHPARQDAARAGVPLHQIDACISALSCAIDKMLD